MKATRVFLVRHGATELSAEDRFAGATDVPLSDDGREQLGGWPRGCAASRSPPSTRARWGARWRPRASWPSRTACGDPADGLREISHGHWEGKRRGRGRESYSRGVRRGGSGDPYTFAPAGGESGPRGDRARAAGAAGNRRRAPGEQVLVVSHKATIRLLVGSLLGFDPRRYRDNLDQSPACAEHRRFQGPAHARLSLFNDTSHYSASSSGTPGIAEHRLSRMWDKQS